MAIINYTTEIDVDRTVMEIEKILSKYGATAIMKNYSEDGKVDAISFKILTEKGELPFKLPMKPREMQQIINNLVKEGKLPKKFFNDKEKALKVGWRILKDWVESQMALIEIRMVKVEEVLLPYMYDSKTNQTYFQMLEKRDFKLGLEYKEDKVIDEKYK